MCNPFRSRYYAVLVEPLRADLCCKTPKVAAGNARQRIQWRLRLDEVLVRVNSKQKALWQAVDHKGEVLEVDLAKTRDRRAALAFLRHAVKRLGPPRSIVTDRLRSSRAALSNLGIAGRQDTARWLNNRAKNPSAVPMTEAIHATFPKRCNASEIRLHSRCHP